MTGFVDDVFSDMSDSNQVIFGGMCPLSDQTGPDKTLPSCRIKLNLFWEN